MSFKISALSPEKFEKYFRMSDTELASAGACKQVVTEYPGSPCRITLTDAPVGETVFLVNYTHLAAHTPYRASHAIFVRQTSDQYRPRPGEIPQSLASRLLSVRAFDTSDMMITADVVPGENLASLLEQFFADPQVDYVHLHYAKQGCFAASVKRA